MAKTPNDKSPKLEINYEMARFDLKDRGFYDDLSDEEKKKFSTYLMIRYGSAVQGQKELQEYYLLSTNQNLNKHYFSIPKAHDKLRWLMATCVSPDMGKHRHEWIAFKGKSGKNKRVELLSKLYPDQKIEDLDTLSQVMSDTDIKRLLVDQGWSDKDIKEALK